MPNPHKAAFLADIQRRFGALHKLAGSQSLFVIGEEAAVIYIRYSKLHESDRTFFGLRATDLRQLEGRNSYICFLLDDSSPPWLIPYADFEEIFAGSQPANDGQYKVQLIFEKDGVKLYIARQGRFN